MKQRIKKNAPRRQPQGVRVQGLARKSENDSKVILPHFARKCKSRTTVREGGDTHHGQGGGDPLMTLWEFAFVLVGVWTVTKGLFRVIDLIEGR